MITGQASHEQKSTIRTIIDLSMLLWISLQLLRFAVDRPTMVILSGKWIGKSASMRWLRAFG
jgi:hypothetical protein